MNTHSTAREVLQSTATLERKFLRRQQEARDTKIALSEHLADLGSWIEDHAKRDYDPRDRYDLAEVRRSLARAKKTLEDASK